jgi:hypothetical protein
MSALMLGQRSAMRLFALGLLALATLPTAAHADVVADARSATAACLSAVIDGAPVGDVTEGPIAIRRGKDPVSCTVSISDGQPAVIHEAVMAAIQKRGELFQPAKTRWDPETFASREAFCNLSLRRHFNAVVSTGRPGLRPVAVVTVLEDKARDPRCDKDLGMQTVAAAATPPTAAPAQPADDIKTITPAEPKAKKKGLLRRIPGLSKK